MRYYKIVKRLIFLLTLLQIVQKQSQAQQTVTWSQVRALAYSINPAIIDINEHKDDLIDIGLSYRSQWSGFEGAPQTGMLGIRHTSESMNMSFGGIVMNDRFGPTSQTQIRFFYAYQVKFDKWEENTLSIGLSASASQYRLDGSLVRVQVPGDILLSESAETRLLLNAGLGLYYSKELNSYTGEKYFFGGISVEQAIPSHLQFQSKGGDFADLKREPHYHVFTGIRIHYNDRIDYVEPVVWASKALNTPTHLLAGFRMTFQDRKFWGGAAISSDYELHIHSGIAILDNWGISYANSFYLGNTFGTSVGMTHEILLSYRIRS
jgi:type IX secretion system PorP/SprF family membrane protein